MILNIRNENCIFKKERGLSNTKNLGTLVQLILQI